MLFQLEDKAKIEAMSDSQLIQLTLSLLMCLRGLLQLISQSP